MRQDNYPVHPDRRRSSAPLFRRLNRYQAKSEVMRLALSLIRQCPSIAVSELAKALNCSPRHCQRLFKQELGVAPKDYLQLAVFAWLLHT